MYGEKLGQLPGAKDARTPLCFTPAPRSDFGGDGEEEKKRGDVGGGGGGGRGDSNHNPIIAFHIYMIYTVCKAKFVCDCRGNQIVQIVSTVQELLDG